MGVDFFGTADLSQAGDFIIYQGGLEAGIYPEAVSTGIVLLNSIVDQLPNRAEKATAIERRHHAYDVINEQLYSIASRLGGVLQKRGLQGFPVPTPNGGWREDLRYLLA